MRNAFTIAALISGLSGGAAVAQTLYLGPEEVDTADRDAVAEVLRHCEGLAQNAPDVDVTARFTAPLPPASTEDQPQDLSPQVPENPEQIPARSVPLSLDLEAAISSGDDSEAAGEGAGEGPDSDEGSDGESQQVAAPDLTVVTLEHCKEAGLVF